MDFRHLGRSEKIGLALLALMLIPLIAVVGPHGLGAVTGAVVLIGMVRLAGPRDN